MPKQSPDHRERLVGNGRRILNRRLEATSPKAPSGLLDSRHKSVTIPGREFKSKRRKLGQAGNCEGIEGRTKSYRPSYHSTGRNKLNPSHCSEQCNFHGWRSSTKKAPPSDGRRAQAIINADEKAMGGENEKGFLKLVNRTVPAGGYDLDGGGDLSVLRSR
jgi:hypothetical protein